MVVMHGMSEIGVPCACSFKLGRLQTVQEQALKWITSISKFAKMSDKIKKRKEKKGDGLLNKSLPVFKELTSICFRQRNDQGIDISGLV
jgi:(p)ppGpp synthase/HD superfamily hydrolase